MKANLFKLECLTNLHVGSGDINYNIIDNEVEKDPITDFPVIHASGVKGAIKDASDYLDGKKDIIFGTEGKDNKSFPGTYKFFDAKFLARPLRVGGNSKSAYILTTTINAINDFLRVISEFDCNVFGKTVLPDIDFNGKKFLVSDSSIKNIEGERSVGNMDSETKDFLKKIFGNIEFAISDSFDGYDLPVIARNYLENGISKNLWYEEFVPHHSLFYLIILTPDDSFELDFSKPIQFGGNASIGNGFTKITAIK